MPPFPLSTVGARCAMAAPAWWLILMGECGTASEKQKPSATLAKLCDSPPSGEPQSLGAHAGGR